MRLSTDGDDNERRYWHDFVADRFPSYEAFWLTHVVPLTRRNVDRGDISFLSREELAATELAATADEDVAVAQLNYTTLIHLGRVYDLLRDDLISEQLPTLPRALPGPGSAVPAAQSLSATWPVESGGSATWSEARASPVYSSTRDLDFDAFTEAFVRSAAASDVADELLERQASPGQYDPRDEGAGKRARWAWRGKHGDPLKPIRDYRNRLVHGRVVPRRMVGDSSMYPRLNKVNEYLDWRRAIDPDSQAAVRRDFDRGSVIISGAWGQTVTYVETNWRSHLLAE